MIKPILNDLPKLKQASYDQKKEVQMFAFEMK